MARYTIAGFNMPQLSILAGGMMSILGISFFVGTNYLTALFPLLFGILMAGAGAISIARPSQNALAMHIAFFVSSISVILGVATAVAGSWVTITSLIEQLMMSTIGAGHVFAGYSAYRFGKPNSKTDSQTCGKSEVVLSEKGNLSISDILGTPEERINPTGVFTMIVE